MKKEHVIGAVMPHYNHGRYIGAAVQTIRPQVDALVVVDDGSRRGDLIPVLSAVKRYSASFCGTKENKGTASAINDGILGLLTHGYLGLQLSGADKWTQDNESPKTRWLTWVSADNTYRPNWRDTLLGAVEDDVGAVYTAYNWYRGRGVPQQGQKKFQPYDPDRLINQPNRCFFGPSFIIREDVWERAGPHRGRNAHDYDHWLRVEEVCWDMGLRIVGVDTVTCDFRAHPERASEYRNNKHWWDQHKWQQEAIKRRSENPSS